jgi:hypothetical protein
LRNRKASFALPGKLRAFGRLKGDSMINEPSRVRQNYLAILVAAMACFLLEAVWFSFFMQAWLEASGAPASG